MKNEERLAIRAPGRSQDEVDKAFIMSARAGNTGACDIFLDVGAQIDATMPQPGIGQTALHEAAKAGHLETAQLLIKRGAAVDCRNDWTFTPLYDAVRENHREVALFLVAHGASTTEFAKKPNDPDWCNEMPLRVGSTNFKGMTMRQAALKLGDIPRLQELMEQQLPQGESDDYEQLIRMAKQSKMTEVAAFLQAHAASQAIQASRRIPSATPN